MLPVSARYYDGLSATRQGVRVMLSEDGRALTILGVPDVEAIDWPLEHLRALRGQGPKPGQTGQMTLTLHQPDNRTDAMPLDPARLVVRDTALIAALRERCPRLMRRDRRPGMWGRMVRRGAVATAAVIVMLFFILPRLADTLAGFIPVEREVAFGRAVVGQIEAALGAADLGALDCEAPAGRAALDAMTARLSDGAGLQYELEMKVLDHGMINAFAAPGGQIVIMRGLLDDAASADAAAAVLAHEIGHVEARDATRHALRAAGSAGLLSMVMGDLTGGAAAAFLGELILQASYTREAEATADRFALSLLNDAGVSSTGMAEFFDSLPDGEASDSHALPSYFSTHPASTARAERAVTNAATQTNTRPVINDAEWQALQGICD